MKTLIDRNHTNAEIARLLGVTEGAVRYRRKNVHTEKPDGRGQKISKLHGYEDIVRAWVSAHHGTSNSLALKMSTTRADGTWIGSK